MYIPEFIAGALSVITAEMIAFIAFVVNFAINHRVEKEEREDDGTKFNE